MAADPDSRRDDQDPPRAETGHWAVLVLKKKVGIFFSELGQVWVIRLEREAVFVELLFDDSSF